MNMEKKALNYLDKNTNILTSLAKDIWDHPQDGLEETYASKLISDKLEEAGFSVKRDVGYMPTAFLASWGVKRPIIGILGEYDALPGISQKVSSKKEAVIEGGFGHGCGHNLLGVGSLGAALAVKEVMEKNKIKGTIRYYGCPAEETLVGKVFMAKYGVFDDLDGAITWHPMYANTVWNSSSLAMNSFKFNFHGVSAHASDLGVGRSAFDAAILTDIGINYLRDNIMPEARIHGVITNGGLQPNILPPYAQSWYYVRAPHRDQVKEIYQRVLDIAKGATLMTGTTFDVEFIVGCYDYLANDIIGEVILEKLNKIGPPKFTNKEKSFAKELKSKVSPDIVKDTLKTYGLTREAIGEPLSEKIVYELGGFAKGDLINKSTEVGDVSYITPTAQFTTCCMPLGVGVHTWQAVASCGSTIGFKGMMLAAKTMALTVLDLMVKPKILKAAFAEFKKITDRKRYISPLPKSLISPIKKFDN